MRTKRLLLLLVLALQACAHAPSAPEPEPSPIMVTHYVMHSPSSTAQKPDCFDITETLGIVTFANEDGNILRVPEIGNSFFPTPCNPNARPYEPLRSVVLDSVTELRAPAK